MFRGLTCSCYMYCFVVGAFLIFEGVVLDLKFFFLGVWGIVEIVRFWLLFLYKGYSEEYW